MVTMNLGHLGRFIIGSCLPKRTNRSLYEFEPSKLFKLFLAGFKFDIGDAVGVSEAGEGIISIIHTYKVAS